MHLSDCRHELDDLVLAANLVLVKRAVNLPRLESLAFDDSIEGGVLLVVHA